VEAWTLRVLVVVDVGEVVNEYPAITSMLKYSAIGISLPRDIV
jgi:hypothetical protein